MLRLLQQNAYHILGLDTSAEIKDILRRSQEIEHRLGLGSVLKYDFDIEVSDDLRTPNTIKTAVQKLQNPKKKVQEYFFWFHISDDIDKQAFELARKKDYSNAIRIWQNAAETDTAKSFFYKKNLALLLDLALLKESNMEYLRDSVAIWQEIINSNKFWTQFIKEYESHNSSIDRDFLLAFKSQAASNLSDFYTDLHEFHDNSEYLNEFQNVFSVRGEKVQKTVLDPAFRSINTVVERLESMNISEDGVLDLEEKSELKHSIIDLQKELNDLLDHGLYEDSQTKTMCDRAANALRKIVLDLHNNLNELEKSKKLLEIAINIAGTNSLKNKLKSELKQIEKNLNDEVETNLVLEIPGNFKTSTIALSNSFLEYNGDKVFYKDIISTSFDSTVTQHSVYGIPTGTSYQYNWSVDSDDECISISLSAKRDESKEKEIWMKLLNASMGRIEPLLIKKIIDQIFNHEEEVEIGGVIFTKEGYYRTKWKMFRENEKIMVYWTGKIYAPEMNQGQVILWNGEGKLFHSIHMSTPNAVIIPNLIEAFRDKRC